MKKKFFVVAAVMIGSQLNAQLVPAIREVSEDSSARFLDEAVITANKYPNKTSLTGKVVTIITREQLEKSGGMDLSQILTSQTGLIVNGANSNPGKDKTVYLLGARGEHTLITIDGIPAYDPSGIGGQFDLRNLSIDNIERIEILKGSQSTLYGNDAIAGVINIITRKKPKKPFSFNSLVSFGSNETFRANAAVHGIKGKMDYQLSYALLNSEGINEAVNRFNTTNVDKDELHQYNIQFGLGFKVSEKIYLRPFFRYGHLKGSIDQGAFLDELDYTYKQEGWQGGVKAELGLGKAKLNLSYNYNSIDREYVDDSVNRNSFFVYSRGFYEGWEHSAESYLYTALSGSVNLTAGIDFRSSMGDQEYIFKDLFATYPPINYSSDSLRHHQESVYAALDWTKNEFHLEAGGRVNFHSEYGAYPVFSLNPSWLMKKKLKLFTNLATGFRTPSLYQFYSEYGNKNLKPESSFSIEAGFQFFTPDNKSTGQLVFFNRNVKDVIFFYFNPVTFQSQYINQDKQKDHGFEAEITYKITATTTLKGFYNFTKGKISTKQFGKDTTYNNLLRRPESGLGLTISSQLKPKFHISTNLSFTGKRKDAYFDPLLFTTVNTELKSYLLWDLYAEYSFLKNKLKLFANLRNILDSDYTEISGFNTLGFSAYGGVRCTL